MSSPPPGGFLPPTAPRSRPVSFLGRVTIICLGIVVLTDLFFLKADLAFLSVLQDLDAGIDVSYETIVAKEDAQAVASLVVMGGMVLAAVAFVAWFHRMYRNSDAVAPGSRRYGTGWSIGAWFVPILSLWRPKKIANDMWRAAEGSGEDGRVGGVVHWWWGLFVATWFGSNFYGQAFFGAETLAEQIEMTQLEIAAIVLDIVAALVAMRYVQLMTNMHERRRAGSAAIPVQVAGLPTVPAVAVPSTSVPPPGWPGRPGA